jgi:hypothetical protein
MTRKAEYGNHPIEPPPSCCTTSGMPLIGCPPDNHSARPRAMLSMARVMMNGCGSRPQTSTPPLTAPIAAPVASMARMTSVPDPIDPKTRAPTTADSASVDPTDRSIPRVTITSS